MRNICRALALLLFALPALAGDVAEARKVFEGNLAAIHAHDRAKYLSYYLHSERLVRGGPTGFSTAYDDFAKGAGSAWPDLIEGSDLHLTPLQPGLVYGTYRYRVRYGADEHAGISERLFVKTPDGWKITVTGAIDTPPGTPAPPRALTGATLIDGVAGDRQLENATDIMRDEKNDCAGSAAEC